MSHSDTERQTGIYSTYPYTLLNGLSVRYWPWQRVECTSQKSCTCERCNESPDSAQSLFILSYQSTYNDVPWSQWPFGLNRRSTAAQFWGSGFQSRWDTNVPLVFCCVLCWWRTLTRPDHFQRSFTGCGVVVVVVGCVCVCVCVCLNLI